jgi:hypothetical protein
MAATITREQLVKIGETVADAFGPGLNVFQEGMGEKYNVSAVYTISGMVAGEFMSFHVTLHPNQDMAQVTMGVGLTRGKVQ